MNPLGIVAMPHARQGTARRPAPMESTLWAGGLGLLFLLVYGGTNAWTGTLDQVPSFHWAWEREIPLLLWSVVPYWSLDLFFLGSFFLVPPDAATLTEGLDAIRRGLAEGPVYVHCALGLGRSAHLILAWLEEQGLDEDQARARLLSLRPRAVLYRRPARSAEPV